MHNQVIFREYDIRGVYERDYDLDFCRDLGRAFVSFVRDTLGRDSVSISVGHDARLSSPEITAALIDGLVDSGARVIRLGMITTPISYFSMYSCDVDGAIMVTGSHNPPEYNGFKVSLDKASLFGDQIQRIGELVLEKRFAKGSGRIEDHDILTPYLKRYHEEFGQLKSIPIVLDCGNGAAGVIVRKLYEGCGLKPQILFEEPDGRFPNHHPDPTVEENLVDLKAAIKKTGAVCGIGFDGDADRVVVVSEKGEMIGGDELMILVSRDILKSNPGATIIGDVKCSDRLYEDVRKRGGNPIMWKTGHSLIKNKVKEENAPFGGELSGHICFADRNYGFDDALYASLRVVEILSKSGTKVSELLADLPKVYNTPEIRIDTTEEKKVSIVEHLKQKYSRPSDNYRVNLIDGVRISYKDGWALARSSNTQPVLVLRFEAESPEALQRIQNEIEAEVNPRL